MMRGLILTGLGLVALLALAAHAAAHATPVTLYFHTDRSNNGQDQSAAAVAREQRWMDTSTVSNGAAWVEQASTGGGTTGNDIVFQASPALGMVVLGDGNVSTNGLATDHAEVTLCAEPRNPDGVGFGPDSVLQVSLHGNGTLIAERWVRLPFAATGGVACFSTLLAYGHKLHDIDPAQNQTLPVSRTASGDVAVPTGNLRVEIEADLNVQTRWRLHYDQPFPPRSQIIIELSPRMPALQVEAGGPYSASAPEVDATIAATSTTAFGPRTCTWTGAGASFGNASKCQTTVSFSTSGNKTIGVTMTDYLGRTATDNANVLVAAASGGGSGGGGTSPSPTPTPTPTPRPSPTPTPSASPTATPTHSPAPSPSPSPAPGPTCAPAQCDRDGDGRPDRHDAFPDDPREWSDLDGDGVGDNADLDADGDGFSDAEELAAGSNPMDAGSVPIAPTQESASKGGALWPILAGAAGLVLLAVVVYFVGRRSG